jgi:hypothetical protein
VLAIFAIAVSLHAAAQPATAEDAVRIASSAFEYRDFEKVIEALDPWLHPLRIADAKLATAARSLLGVARHVTGDVPRAREEFSQLLMLDPDHKLDPFKIPPQVIETLEAVRLEMKPVLDKLRDERGLRKVVEPADQSKIVVLPSRWVTLVPGGVPQFALDQPEWGAVLGSVQLLGLVANIGGYAIADGADPSAPSYDTGRIVQYVGLGTLVAGYVTSVLLGNVFFDGYKASVLGPEGTAAGLTFQFSF